jgi:hypothetical protein
MIVVIFIGWFPCGFRARGRHSPERRKLEAGETRKPEAGSRPKQPAGPAIAVIADFVN